VALMGQELEQGVSTNDADVEVECHSSRVVVILENAPELREGYGRESATWNRVRTWAKAVLSSMVNLVATSWTYGENTGHLDHESVIATLVENGMKSSIVQVLANGWALDRGDSNMGGNLTSC